MIKPDHGVSVSKKVVIYTDKDTVSCMGLDNDHPKVYIKVPGICGYCDINYLHLDETVL